MSSRQLKTSRSQTLRTIQRFLLYAVALCSFNALQAQQIRVNGGFLSDSLKIGEQTAFYLAAHYPRNLNVLFPDSTFAFTPFEYQQRRYFATETQDSISVDSTVYYLTTFEVDRVQSLSLPVFVVQAQDCTTFLSPRDSVYITQLVAAVPDTIPAERLPLKMETAYQNVLFEFNLWVLLIIAGVLVLLAGLTWVFFGKRIRAYFLVRRLTRKHDQFKASYGTLVAQLQQAFSAITTESALSTWKKYMEQLEVHPYTKLTTPEMLKVIDNEGLGKNLSAIDAAIYGHNTSVLGALEQLKTFADQRFLKKLAEVKHGK
jgi:hypothetical protein